MTGSEAEKIAGATPKTFGEFIANAYHVV